MIDKIASVNPMTKFFTKDYLCVVENNFILKEGNIVIVVKVSNKNTTTNDMASCTCTSEFLHLNRVGISFIGFDSNSATSSSSKMPKSLKHLMQQKRKKGTSNYLQLIFHICFCM